MVKEKYCAYFALPALQSTAGVTMEQFSVFLQLKGKGYIVRR